MLLCLISDTLLAEPTGWLGYSTPIITLISDYTIISPQVFFGNRKKVERIIILPGMSGRWNNYNSDYIIISSGNGLGLPCTVVGAKPGLFLHMCFFGNGKKVAKAWHE